MANEVPVPYAEAPWITGIPSPYYNDSHRKWQKDLRAYISENLTQHAMEWEEQEQVPESVYAKFAADNMLIPSLPAPLPLAHLRAVGIHTLLGGLKIEDFDAYHGAIYGYEMIQCGLTGPPGSLVVGIAYGCPPLIKFGNKKIQEQILPEVLTGKKRICIAITEPDAGSDVANITTTATKSEDGKHYIVNGTKKWITNGLWSDYASMAVRTGGKGPGGVSLLIVPLKNQDGVEMRKIKVQGSCAAGTTFIELDDVRVPVENLLGKENEGMKYIMTNFNHERLSIAINVTTQARIALASTFAYAMRREAFGQKLIAQPVVRHRLAKAGADMEAMWAWVEHFVYAVGNMSKEDGDRELGGMTALAKAKAGMVLNECAQVAVLIHGGNGYSRSGQGALAEKLSREVFGARIPGGSEDVMLDLSVRQLLKLYEAKVKAAGKSRL